MYRLILLFVLITVTGAAAMDRDSDLEVCRNDRLDVAKQAAAYHGEDRIARLIHADLMRARKEEAEGGADECIEALDHAKKLIAGQY
jgi:hypothetical protein